LSPEARGPFQFDLFCLSIHPPKKPQNPKKSKNHKTQKNQKTQKNKKNQKTKKTKKNEQIFIEYLFKSSSTKNEIK
jgi:hypothetical protein